MVWHRDLGGQIQWRTDTVDLGILAGEPCVTLAFANIGDYGNHIWIDNVNVTGDMSVAVEEFRPNGRMVVFPNPSAGNFSVITPQSWAGQVYMIFDQTGKLCRGPPNRRDGGAPSSHGRGHVPCGCTGPWQRTDYGYHAN